MSRLSQRVRRSLPVVIAMGYLACAQPVMYKNGATTFPPREATCAFDVLASHPGPGYVEVAQIGIEGDQSFGAGQYRNPREFAQVVQPKVCAAGGDVLATEVNGAGSIVRGIVFHRISEPEAPALPPGAPPSTVAGTCEPICSPGFACNAGVCAPQCNPACTGDETCGNDRLCHPSR
jgi:hypothetical protein